MRLRLLSSLAAAAVLAGAFWARPAHSDGFTLVRCTRNETATLTRAQVRELALGRRKAWPHGPVALLVLSRPGTPELHWFASSLVGVSEASLMSRIKEQVFKGEMRKPVVAASEQDALTAVAAEEGAIGVVRSETAKSLPAGVSVLNVR